MLCKYVKKNRLSKNAADEDARGIKSCFFGTIGSKVTLPTPSCPSAQINAKGDSIMDRKKIVFIVITAVSALASVLACVFGIPYAPADTFCGAAECAVSADTGTA